MYSVIIPPDDIRQTIANSHLTHSYHSYRRFPAPKHNTTKTHDQVRINAMQSIIMIKVAT